MPDCWAAVYWDCVSWEEGELPRSLLSFFSFCHYSLLASFLLLKCVLNICFAAFSSPSVTAFLFLNHGSGVRAGRGPLYLLSFLLFVLYSGTAIIRVVAGGVVKNQLLSCVTARLIPIFIFPLSFYPPVADKSVCL